MRLPEEPEKPLQINVVPMIDVVFAVLAFFLLSSLFLTQNQGLTVALPGAQTATTQPQKPVTVTIDATGQVTVADRSLKDDQIAPTVQTLITQGSSKLVLIQADQAVSHGRVVAVMDQVFLLLQGLEHQSTLKIGLWIIGDKFSLLVHLMVKLFPASNAHVENFLSQLCMHGNCLGIGTDAPNISSSQCITQDLAKTVQSTQAETVQC